MNAIAERAAYYARIAQYAADQVTQFNTVYLGAKATAPTTDNDGNPLIVGALYFNSTDDVLYVWDGATWVQEVTINSAQTITGQKTFTQNIIGNVTGNATTATTLATGRTIAISGAVTGTATSFNGSANITIPAVIASGATITSPVLAGTATGSLTSKVVQGVTDGSTPVISSYIGELLQGNQTSTAITTGATVTAVTLSLTAGEWEVFGNATFNFSGTTVTTNTTIAVGVSDTAATLQTDKQQVMTLPAFTTVTLTPAFALVSPKVPVSTSVSTSAYLVVKAPTFSLGTITFSATLKARRVR
jgi:hypothetical protein